MKILHCYKNAKKFIKNFPFYNFIFKHPELESLICDFLEPGEAIPNISILSPIQTIYNENDFKNCIEKFKPTILHCHNYSLLEEAIHCGKLYNIPVAFSIYRNNFNDFAKNIDFFKTQIENIKLIFTPNRQIKQFLHDNGINVQMTVLSEVLEYGYNFKPTTIDDVKRIYTFAILISEFNEDYINNVHHGLEKIIVTNNELKISWICFDEKIKKNILTKIKQKPLSKYVTITELTNFPLLEYDGLITDGNQKNLYTEEQYLHIILSCLRDGKFIITRHEPGLEDLLINGGTCIQLPDYTSNKLSHLIHFFISFPEEMATISNFSKKFYSANYSVEVNSGVLIEAYKRVIIFA